MAKNKATAPATKTTDPAIDPALVARMTEQLKAEIAAYKAAVEPQMKRVRQARQQLILRKRFWGALTLALDVEHGAVGTACTDGRRVIWDPRFVATLSSGELLAVWAHEVMHCCLHHAIRIRNRDPRIWNYAGDFVINLLLDGEGFSLPKQRLFDAKYADMSTETVYELLRQEQGERKKNGKGDEDGAPGDGLPGVPGVGNPDSRDHGMGGVIAPGEVVDEASAARLERHWRTVLASAAQAARMAGHLSAALDRLVRDILDPPLPWPAILQEFIDRQVKTDYSWKRPNRRTLGLGVVLPSVQPDEVGPLAVIVDTSGSIDQTILDKFANEVTAIALNVRPSEIRVYYVDSKLCAEETFEVGDPVVMHPSGGGGTSFRPAFEKIERDGFEPMAAIYFTDLYSTDYPDMPEFPVLWAHHQADTASYTPPFGELVEIV